MAAKAKLTVILRANETVVAEVEDAELWQKVLAAINKGAQSGGLKNDASSNLDAIDTEPLDGDEAIARFAKDIGVSSKDVSGAMSPSKKAPYLQLDHHYWAAMKKATPQRGPGAVSATTLAGTLLALWVKEARLDIAATQALAADVLKTIDVVDKNPSRGIKNTKWLQARSGGTIVINAAEISKAQAIAKAFCKKDWATYGSQT